MTGFDDLNEAGKDGSDGGSPDEAESTGSTDDADPNEPAFPFDEAVQAQIYPRKSTHEAFEDFLDIDVKRHLRDRGVRNETGRELHEAVLRVAMDHPEAIAETLAAQREE